MKGAEIGSEVGFYRGCFLVWSHATLPSLAAPVKIKCAGCECCLGLLLIY